MKQRLLLFAKYYLFWVVFFVVQKPLFMLVQYRLLGEVRAIDWLLVPWHGLPLDLSVAAYVTAVAGVLLCIGCWVRWSVIQRVLTVYSGIILFVGLWTMLGDNGCFPSWGYHLNKDIFSYLASPNEALACAPWWVWLLGCGVFAVLFVGWIWLYRRWMRTPEAMPITGSRMKILYTSLLVLLTGALFLPMRGSVTVSTINTGRVYFSDNRMLNLAAINPVFNILETLSEDHFSSDRYQFMSAEEAEQLTSALLPDTLSMYLGDTLFTCPRPNIVLCILESFSKNAMDAGAMPQLSRMAQEGVFFSNMYAASYRTDRGVMAILGAFPGCATSSLMLVPSKSGQLPQIGNILRAHHYNLSFYYGGDEDFTNMRSYLITGGFERRIVDHDFPLSAQLSKWGVPDHIVLDRAASEIAHRPMDAMPSFDVILTLSSHEPFEVPYHHMEHPYLNAIAYTDSCLGAFVDTLRHSPQWDSTIVIMMADHGYAYPDGIQSQDTLHYKIPMVMVGGAIRQPRLVNTLCQQIDWVPTLLHQMGLSAAAFPYAKDIMDDRIAPFAYYHYWDGFTLMNDSARVTYDVESDQVIMGQDSQLVRQGKAWTQTIMQTIYQL